MVRVSPAEMARCKAAVRKVKRKDNAKFIRKMSGKPRLPSIATLKQKLWDLTTILVKLRDGPICKACGVGEGYALNHIIPQCEAPGLIFDLENVFWGCRGCNCAEKMRRVLWNRVHFPRIFGQALIGHLTQKAQRPVQLRRPDYMVLIAERTAAIEAFRRIG